MTSRDLTKWAIVVLLVVVGLVALMFARRLIVPLDNLVTEQACTTHGRDVLSREVVDHERSNRFSLIDRTKGYCVFGPVVEFDEDGEVIDLDAGSQSDDEAVAGADEAAPVETIQVPLDEIDTGPFYRWMKIIFVVLQLGAASLAVRILADPLLDRFVRTETAL